MGDKDGNHQVEVLSSGMVQGEQEAAEALQEVVMEVAMAQEKETVQWEDLVQATVQEVQEVQAEVEAQDHHHPLLPIALPASVGHSVVH